MFFSCSALLGTQTMFQPLQKTSKRGDAAQYETRAEFEKEGDFETWMEENRGDWSRLVLNSPFYCGLKQGCQPSLLNKDCPYFEGSNLIFFLSCVVHFLWISYVRGSVLIFL